MDKATKIITAILLFAIGFRVLVHLCASLDNLSIADVFFLIVAVFIFSVSTFYITTTIKKK